MSSTTTFYCPSNKRNKECTNNNPLYNVVNPIKEVIKREWEDEILFLASVFYDKFPDKN